MVRRPIGAYSLQQQWWCCHMSYWVIREESWHWSPLRREDFIPRMCAQHHSSTVGYPYTHLFKTAGGVIKEMTPALPNGFPLRGDCQSRGPLSWQMCEDSPLPEGAGQAEWIQVRGCINLVPIHLTQWPLFQCFLVNIREINMVFLLLQFLSVIRHKLVWEVKDHTSKNPSSCFSLPNFLLDFWPAFWREMSTAQTMFVWSPSSQGQGSHSC